MFKARCASLDDLDALLLLEEIWPETNRASREELNQRLSCFPEGYFIGEDDSGLLGSIIARPYTYDPNDISNFSTWSAVNQACWRSDINTVEHNALYILSGTSKPGPYGAHMFASGIQHVVDLAIKLNKTYVVAGALLPGYAKFLAKYQTDEEPITAAEYVFTKSQGRFVDPMMERYRQLGFCVPSPTHVMPNYFDDAASLNYSALVVKQVLHA